MSKSLRFSIPCLLLLLFQSFGAFAQSPVEKKRVAQPAQSAMPPGVSAEWSHTKGKSLEALRGLSTLEVVFDQSFAKCAGLDVVQSLAYAERRLGEAGVTMLKDGKASTSPAGQSLYFSFTVIKDTLEEGYYILATRLIEDVIPKSDTSKIIQAVTWHLDAGLSIGARGKIYEMAIAKSIESMIDLFIRDLVAANRK